MSSSEPRRQFLGAFNLFQATQDDKFIMENGPPCYDTWTMMLAMTASSFPRNRETAIADQYDNQQSTGSIVVSNPLKCAGEAVDIAE